MSGGDGVRFAGSAAEFWRAVSDFVGRPCCVGCGVTLNAAELTDEGRDECGPCHERGARHEAAAAEVPSPAECVGDEARAELQALAEALNGEQVPLVDAVPFTLQAEVRRESKREAAARQPSIF